ncbi:hypothetical protein STEG23_035552 [Scotinomys teguina]
MDTTISGCVFLNLPEILSSFASADRKNRRSKTRSNPSTPLCPSRASTSPASTGQSSGSSPDASSPFLPAPGSARLRSALGCRARFAFGCFRSRKWLAAEKLPAQAADVGQASSCRAGLLEPRSSSQVGGWRRGPTGSGGEPGGRSRQTYINFTSIKSFWKTTGNPTMSIPFGDGEKEDLENTKVNSPLASASDPEPQSSPYRKRLIGICHRKSFNRNPVVQMAKYQAPQRSGDMVMIQSEHTGAVDVLSADLESADLLGDHRKVSPPLMAPPCIWTFAKVKEFKSKLGKEKNSRLVVKRGEVVTIRVPTHPEGKRVCWEFATDDYDIGFGVYFDWTPVTSTDITVQVSDSSEDEDEEEEDEEDIEEPVPVGDVERGSRSSLRGRYGEVMPVYRRDSHRDVQAGSHDYPGEGIYLLKFDNSYSLLRNKTLYFHIYYTS